jgi:hypothetical protein
MPQTYTLEFHTVLPDVFTKLKSELAKSAKVTTDQNGDLEISGDGITAEAHYDPASQVLTVNVLDWPWYLNIGMIHDQIQIALETAAKTA